MDSFLEEVAVKHNRGLQSLLYALCWVVMILVGLTAFFLFSTLSAASTDMTSLIVRMVVVVVLAGVVYLIWRYKDIFRTEYEYTFTNGDLDVSSVLGNNRRRYLTSLPMKNVEACGKVQSSAFQRYVNTPGVKKHNWFLNRDGQLIFFYFVKNNVKHLMIVELSEEMQKIIRSQNYLGFGVWQD